MCAVPPRILAGGSKAAPVASPACIVRDQVLNLLLPMHTVPPVQHGPVISLEANGRQRETSLSP